MQTLHPEYQFRTDLGRNIFLTRYALTQAETWRQRAKTIVDEVCGTAGGTKHALLSEEELALLVEAISTFKYLPGGRYIYYAGREANFYNNCFSGDTKVLTDSGWRQVNELGDAHVLSPVDGRYKPAKFVSHGKQPVYRHTFKTRRGHQRHAFEVTATRTHRWLLEDGSDTYDLRVGDVIPANTYDAGYDELGFVHGFMFGDGSANGAVRLCCGKDLKLIPQLQKIEHTITYPKTYGGDPVLRYKQNVEWKELPPLDSSPAYIASFIRGWLKADGNETTVSNKLCSINKAAIEWFHEHAAFAGITITGELRYQDRDVTIGEYEYINHRLYIQTYCWGGSFAGYKLVAKELIGEQEVFCPYEPEYNRIVIDHNIDTYQCYLFKSTEDNREAWAELCEKATSALMTGGGIGNDYSIFRPRGSLLSRTGGQASGPIPLMQMVNEIGRNVMQGGSRRSAIYASLNWAHEDIDEFLSVKDWDAQRIPGTDLSYGDAKKADFNYPCPLDMTNISLNYDDAWLNLESRHQHPTFLHNVRYAMRNGEPGFSFNFGDQQDETARNACTEVTSEDDSDVCNLGSLNMGAIDSLEEFKAIVAVASKFLVCGTIRGTLPNKKIEEVREKNRRLGLGLMGMHEWLLKRSYRYEANPELTEWLEVYRDVSESAANEQCDRFYISRPVADRAIAPTGTIGILAGTTGGIEPLYAVAYKRRYIIGGTKYRYEYVVDHTAQTLIDQHGVDPESIETAADLAKEPERRIAFQAYVQDFVDMAISSTLNLPEWGSRWNNEKKVEEMAAIISKYAPRLRGLTFYPDGARGGQPITQIPYEEAIKHKGLVFEENIDCGGSGVCGI